MLRYAHMTDQQTSYGSILPQRRISTVQHRFVPPLTNIQHSLKLFTAMGELFSYLYRIVPNSNLSDANILRRL